MDLDVVRTRQTGTAEEATPRDRTLDGPLMVDVSDVSASGVAEYVRVALDHDRVHLEQRGGRTFLVADD
ncbi:hypothetical protein [Halomarina ordinaria]|uniref:Uncharacterized protein n=1 Tax=Halomarina ordinaria TaxID=3033939 RepID=A0ABD5UDH9_9EURY|nr:hypothetical protein [Halomarina sp. PSRA2]